MTRSETFNFSAGPSVLPEEVLRQAQAELLNYHGTGMSVMEMSHRSQAFSDIFQDVKARFRAALSVPDTHEILFLQGGGTAQFSMIPLNLMGEQGAADYAVTGHFSGNAAKEAEKYGKRTGTTRTSPPRISSSWTPRRLISITAPTTPSTAPSGSTCRRPAACRSRAICRRIFSRARSTCQNTV